MNNDVAVQDEKVDALVNIDKAISEAQNIWGVSSKQINSIRKSAALTNTKHGLLSGVPIVCKADDCPFANVCRIDPTERIKGERCPVEIGSILVRFEKLCAELEITEEDSTDLGQVKQAVDIEIMILRCDNKIAIDADVIEKSVKDVAKNGRILHEFKVSPAVGLKLELIEKHSRILKDLVATRSSKKEIHAGLDPSSQAAELIRKSKEIDTLKKEYDIEVLDADYEEVTPPHEQAFLGPELSAEEIKELDMLSKLENDIEIVEEE